MLRSVFRAIQVSCLLLVAACGSGTDDSKPEVTAAELRENMNARLSAEDYVGALAVARTLTKRFPDSPEAIEISAQLPGIQSAAAKQRQDTAQARAEAAQKATGEANQEKNQRLEACRAELKKANELGVLYDLTWNPPATPRVVAGPTFFTLSIDGKQGFAETVNCFLVGGADDKMTYFEVLHWQTGRPVGKFSYGRFSMN